MRVVVFGGTTEGRTLALALAKLGAQVTVCVATPYGREQQPTAPGLRVETGRRTAPQMAELLAGQDLCVDATHPYAAQATQNIRAAARLAGVPCRRLLRPPTPLPPGSVTVPDAAAAAAWLAPRPGRVLLTTGAKELPAFAGLEPERLCPRVLPVAESLAACEALGIPHRNILAMQGPFTLELNRAILAQWQIRYLVTKDGGRAGGMQEKLQAARELGVTPVVLCRPAETGQTMEEILEEGRRLLTCR